MSGPSASRSRRGTGGWACWGLGALGADAARALADLGFTVAGWSRSAKAIDGIDCRHGEAGLDELIAHSDIVVCLLPLTPETENILDAALFARLPRGGHLVEDDLVAALETGHLSAAALDVTREEPPPRQPPRPLGT